VRLSNSAHHFIIRHNYYLILLQLHKYKLNNIYCRKFEESDWQECDVTAFASFMQGNIDAVRKEFQCEHSLIETETARKRIEKKFERVKDSLKEIMMSRYYVCIHLL